MPEDNRKNENDPCASLRNLLNEFGLLETWKEYANELNSPNEEDCGTPPSFAYHVWQLSQAEANKKAAGKKRKSGKGKTKRDTMPPDLAEGIAQFVAKIHPGGAGGTVATDADKVDEKKPNGLARVVGYLRLAPETRAGSPLKEDILHIDVSQHGGWQRTVDTQLKPTGGDEEKPHFPADQRNDNWGNDGQEVWLDCPADLIPHGLVWLFLKEQDGTVSVKLPELDFNPENGHWWFRKSFRQLFGHKATEDHSNLGFLRATPENRDAFLVPEVRDFVKKLDKDCLQRKQAEAFLAEEGGK